MLIKNLKLTIASLSLDFNIAELNYLCSLILYQPVIFDPYDASQETLRKIIYNNLEHSEIEGWKVDKDSFLAKVENLLEHESVTFTLLNSMLEYWEQDQSHWADVNSLLFLD